VNLLLNRVPSNCAPILFEGATLHILYVHQYFGTPAGSSGTRSYEFARALIARGHHVTMVCGSADRSESGLTSPFLNRRRAGVVDGISVVEYQIGSSNADSLWTRAAKFGGFAMAASREALSRRYDLIFTTSTPLTVAIPGALGRIVRGKPFVFEVRDLWPELPIALGLKSPSAILAMRCLEWIGYKSARRVVALAPGIAEGVARLGVPKSAIASVPNGCDLELFDAFEAKHASALWPDRITPGDFVGVFAGAHGLANGLGALIPVAKILKDKDRHQIKLLLIGSGGEKAKLVADAKAQNLDNLVFCNPIPKTDLIPVIKGADVGLQILANVEAFYRGTSPNKFFDYLAAGRPVLINYPGWLAEFVREKDCGFVVSPDDPQAFADALIAAADRRGDLAEIGARARRLGESEFARDILAAKFVTTLEDAYAEATRRP
jgi:glycosyltransferase involved in cell wall biosynthesis